jgi:hypothetical protein
MKTEKEKMLQGELYEAIDKRFEIQDAKLNQILELLAR